MNVTSFQVKRREPELVPPEKPAPRELKKLSDIDSQHTLRNQIPLLWFYKNNSPSMDGKDPVKVIREALGRALVHYYPIAGRLFEDPDGKLVVNCNGEGILFIEADADFKLEQLGHPIVPPFPFLAEVLYNVPGSDAIGKGCPLLLVQVSLLLSQLSFLPIDIGGGRTRSWVISKDGKVFFFTTILCFFRRKRIN